MISVHVYSEGAIIGQNMLDMFVISIVSPGREHPKMEGTNIHRFHFHDVSEIYQYDDGRLIQPMSESIAEQIAELAMKNLDSDRWIIHCEAGISRSPAVAIGLSKFIKLNPNRRNLKKMYPMFNKHVCQLIEEAMEVKMEKLEKELPVPGCDGYKGF